MSAIEPRLSDVKRTVALLFLSLHLALPWAGADAPEPPRVPGRIDLTLGHESRAHYIDEASRSLLVTRERGEEQALDIYRLPLEGPTLDPVKVGEFASPEALIGWVYASPEKAHRQYGATFASLESGVLCLVRLQGKVSSGEDTATVSVYACLIDRASWKAGPWKKVASEACKYYMLHYIKACPSADGGAYVVTTLGDDRQIFKITVDVEAGAFAWRPLWVANGETGQRTEFRLRTVRPLQAAGGQEIVLLQNYREWSAVTVGTDVLGGLAVTSTYLHRGEPWTGVGGTAHESSLVLYGRLAAQGGAEGMEVRVFAPGEGVLCPEAYRSFRLPATYLFRNVVAMTGTRRLHLLRRDDAHPGFLSLVEVEVKGDPFGDPSFEEVRSFGPLAPESLANSHVDDGIEPSVGGRYLSWRWDKRLTIIRTDGNRRDVFSKIVGRIGLPER